MLSPAISKGSKWTDGVRKVKVCGTRVTFTGVVKVEFCDLDTGERDYWLWDQFISTFKPARAVPSA